MNKFFLFLICFLSLSFLTNCGGIRDSAGVNRKIIDEYAVVNSLPLVIPPDYNILPSEEIIAKKKVQSDDNLAKEILVGLDEDLSTSDLENNSSALDSILAKSGANETTSAIREEIDFIYTNTSSTKGVFSGEKYMSDEEILDAVAESKRIRENIFNNKSILDGDNPITTRPRKRENILKKLF